MGKGNPPTILWIAAMIVVVTQISIQCIQCLGTYILIFFSLILNAVSASWLPFSHQQVFELLADEQQRCQLEILSNEGSLHGVAHIANGSHPSNCISLLRINAPSNSPQNVELLLQESTTHPDCGSLCLQLLLFADGVTVLILQVVIA